jgi:hypothetical protein
MSDATWTIEGFADCLTSSYWDFIYENGVAFGSIQNLPSAILMERSLID